MTITITVTIIIKEILVIASFFFCAGPVPSLAEDCAFCLFLLLCSFIFVYFFYFFRGVLRNIDHRWYASASWWSTAFAKRAALRAFPRASYLRKCHFASALIIGWDPSGVSWRFNEKS